MARNEQATGTVYLDTTSAQFALDKLNQKIDQYDKKLKQGNLTARETVGVEKDRAAAATKAAEIMLQINNKLGPTYTQQKKYVAELTKEIKGLATGSKEFEDALVHLGKQKDVLAGIETRMRGVNQAQEQLVEKSSTLTRTGVAAAGLAVSAFERIASGIQGFFSDAIDEAQGAEEATSRLQNTLDNLGRGDAFDRITGKADELADAFRYLDNDDITAVFTQLITYGKLTERQMNDLLPVIINFAAKQRISISESASVLIKAMEGNAKALKEYGISVKDGSTVTERFGIIMDELKPKVEGAAAAFGDTFAGKAAIAKQEIANLKEDIGTKLLPVLASFYSLVSKGLEGMSRTFTFFKGIYKDIYQGGLLNIGASFGAQSRAAARDMEVQAIAANASQFRATAAIKTKEEYITFLDKKIQDLQNNYQLALSKQDKDTANRIKKTIDGYSIASQKLKESLKVDDGKTLGGGDPNEDATADAAAAKAAKKAVDDRKKLLSDYNEFIKGLNSSITDLLTPEASQKFLAIFKQTADELEKLKKLAQTDQQYQKGKVLILEQQRLAIHKLIEDESRLYKPATEQTSTVDVSGLPKALQDILKGKKGPETKTPLFLVPEILPEDEKAVQAALTKVLDRINRNRQAGQQLDILNARNPKEKRDALLAQLDEEHELEMQNKQLTDNERLLLERQYQIKRTEIAKEFQKELLDGINEYLGFASQITDVIGQLDDARTKRENAALQRDLKANDERKKSIQKLANNQVISQQEAKRQIAAIELQDDARKAALEKKQLERQKKQQIAQAAINGALAVTNIWATTPKADFGVSTFILLGLSAIATLASIAEIASQKFAGGGRAKRIRNGKIDVAQNIPTQPNGDNVLATLKVGEVVLNEDQQRRLGGANTFRAIGVPGFATGGSVKPFWKNRPYRTIDFGKVSESMQIVRFAEGGKVMQPQQATPQTVVQSDPAVLEALQQQQLINQALVTSISNLNDQLSTGIRADVSLRAIDRARNQKDRIAADSEMR